LGYPRAVLHVCPRQSKKTSNLVCSRQSLLDDQISGFESTEPIRSSQFCEVKETTSASPVRVLMKVLIFVFLIMKIMDVYFCFLNDEDNG
jgi:hypothetical protein